MPTPQWNLPDDEPDIDPDNPDDEGPEPPYAGYESEAQLRRMAEVRRLEALRREGLIP